MKEYEKGKYLILVIPPTGQPESKVIQTDVVSMDAVLECKRAEFNYYKDVIIATNANCEGLPQNENMKHLDVYGTCYLIGNNSQDDDFKSLKTKDIKRLMKMILLP